MKRARALLPLSRDHNRALLLARHARRAAEDGTPAAVAAAWEEMKEAWGTDLAEHFDAEERLLFPRLRERGHASLAEQLEREHEAIRRTLTRTDGLDATRLRVVGEVLEHHVRTEEREAFPLLERLLAPAELTAVEADLASP